MKPSMLIRHLETKHPNHPTKSLEFQCHEASLKRQKLILPEVSTKKTDQRSSDVFFLGA